MSETFVLSVTRGVHSNVEVSWQRLPRASSAFRTPGLGIFHRSYGRVAQCCRGFGRGPAHLTPTATLGNISPILGALSGDSDIAALKRHYLDR